jgi:hypothetical protein
VRGVEEALSEVTAGKDVDPEAITRGISAVGVGAVDAAVGSNSGPETADGVGSGNGVDVGLGAGGAIVVSTFVGDGPGDSDTGTAVILALVAGAALGVASFV